MLWASKVAKVPILAISGLPTWEFRDKMTFGCKPMAKHKEYYKGEGGGFLEVRAMVSLMSLCLFMVRSCIENAPTMH
jgi:hypothetical protein